MGIFYKENRSYTPGISNPEDIFTAFPSHVIPAGNLGWDEYRALRSSDLFTALTVISKDVARLDIKIKQKGIIKEKDRLENLLNNRPNAYYNGYMLKFIVTLSSLLTNHGYILVERANGQPVALHHLQTSTVQLKDAEDGGYYYEVNNNGETLEVSFNDVIDIKPYSSTGLDGLSILDALKDDLDAQTYSKKFFANFFRNGTQAGSVLKMKRGKLSSEAREKIKQEWLKANAGERNANTTLVLDETMEFEKLEVDTEILKLITDNKASPTAIAKALGLPPHKLGLESPNTSQQDQMDDYLFNTLSSYTKMWTAELNFKLLNTKDDYTKEFVFDTTAYRQVNWDTFIETLGKELNSGAISLDEYREATGRAPVPDGLGKGHRVDLNHIDLSLSDDFQLRDVTTNNQATKAVSEDAMKGGDSE